MNDLEKYLWDRDGHLVLRGALNSSEVEALREAIRGGRAGLRRSACGSAYRGLMAVHEPLRAAFSSLAVHPAVVERLNTMCRPGFRLDGEPILVDREGDQPSHLCSSNSKGYDRATSYHYQNGHFLSGCVAVYWMLSSHDEGEATFVYEAGTHKVLCSDPREDGARSLDSSVSLHPGDVWFAMHGALRYVERGGAPLQCIRYSFVPRSTMLEPPAAEIVEPEVWWGEARRPIIRQMTPEQRAVMFGPGSIDDSRLGALVVDSTGRVHLEYARGA